jgi:hypothetical protein
MRKLQRTRRRTLDRKLAKELTNEELRRLSGGYETTSCSGGPDD